jgi:hypothetical protein
MPTGLRQRFEEALNDPDLLSLDSDIALLATRVGELVDRVAAGEAGQDWEKLSVAWGAYRHAQRKGETSEAEALLERIGKLIAQGLDHLESWKQISSFAEARRKLAASEQKMRIERRQIVKIEEVIALQQALATAVKTHVRDQYTLTAISNEWRTLLNTNKYRDYDEGQAEALTSGEDEDEDEGNNQ